MTQPRALTPAEQPPGGEHPRYPRLFSPLTVGPLQVKNRIVNSAHTTNFAQGGVYTEQLIAYHRERARGGAAIIVSQATNVVPEYGELRNADDRIVDGYRRVAEAVHPYGAKYFAELSHPGRQGEYTAGGAELYQAPSAIPTPYYEWGWRTPHELEPDQIQAIVAAFEAAARRCLAGGIDGIELHFAHGNLAQQFLSPATNRRADVWGGSLDNRLRFMREVARTVREAVGDRLVVGCRFSGAELFPGGLSQDEALEAARRLDAEGLLDYLSVTMGHYTDLLNTARNMPDLQHPTMLWAPYGAALKEAVQRARVFLVGRITRPEMMEHLVATGHCDMVVLARALIADPELPVRAFDGREDDIRVCVGAQDGCWGRVERHKAMSCVQNPVVSREQEWGGPLPPAATARRVVVVGGGPAGLECARVLAERGHRVVVLEREREPGGQLRLAARSPGRQELGQIVGWLRGQCEKLGVELRLGVEATEALVLGLSPEVVVVATGGAPRELEPELRDGPPLQDAWEVLAGRAKPGRRVLLWDETGQRPGFGVAELLAASGHQVELVTPTIFPGQNIEPSGWRTAYARLLGQGVRFRPLTRLAGAAGGRVEVEHLYSGAREALEGIETIVTARSPRAADGLYHRLKPRLERLYLIGDALAPRGIEEAFYEGQKVGREV
jgi:2,4-dienoyl-CoA reductase-like NADH-dependent reductase (Old Yellow Enzyme family)